MSGPPLQLHVRFNVRFVTIAISAQLKAKQKNKMDRLGSENTTFVKREKTLLYIVFFTKMGHSQHLNCIFSFFSKNLAK